MASLRNLFSLVAAIFYILKLIASVSGETRFDPIWKPPMGEPSAKSEMLLWGNFTQRLDHYNPQDNSTWTMRYLYSDKFFQNGGPIFIFIGGEWIIDRDVMILGQPFELAQQHNGYLFYTEHRFYGKSYPTKDFTVESFKHLTTEQALEDLAYFIMKQKALPKFKNSPVVVIGSSYSAKMSTWMRLKYPHLVDIAYSSSPPLLTKADNYEYFEVVSEVIKKTNKNCANLIQQAIGITEDLLKTHGGVEKVKKAYGLCSNWDSLTEEPHRSYFFYNIFGIFAGIVQGGLNMSNICDQLIKGGQNPFDQLTNYVRNKSNNDCIANYDKFINDISITNTSESSSRQWWYHCCSEGGNFKTTNSKTQIFGNNLQLSYYYRFCQDVFGSKFAAKMEHYGVYRTNMLNGANNPKVSYVLFVQGSHDPWHRLGILKNPTLLSPLILIEGAAHSRDLLEVHNSDSPQLAQAKRQIQNIIGDWLRQIN